MLGGMRPWAQFISLGLSVIAFVLALVPRNYDGELIRNEAYRTRPWKRLLHWPLFWIGSVFFTYVLIQALNPAWAFVQMENSWGMRPIDHIEWLPSGMRTPFEMMNPWRQMMIWGAPFLLACALWTGVTRSKALRRFVTAIVINCVLFALLALIQRATDAKEIYWAVKSSNEFLGAFIYRNHGGAYLVLSFMLTAGLAAWLHRRSRQKMARSSPATLFAFLACVILVAIGVSYSRGSVIALAGCLLWLLFLSTWWFFARNSGRNGAIIVMVLTMMFIGFGTLGLKAFNAERTVDRFKQMLEDNNATWKLRQIATDATAEMWEEKTLYGWGAGGFRFLFPKFQQTRSEILWLDQPRKRGYLFWEYAHNDWIQIAAEVGTVGLGLLGLGVLSTAIIFFKRRGWHHPLAIVCVGGCLATIGHSRAEFLFYNPAIINLWTTIGVITLIAVSIETHARSNR